MDQRRDPAPVGAMAPRPSRRTAVREALLTPLQLVPLAFVPVLLYARNQGWVADVPMWVLVGSLLVAQTGSNLAHAIWPASCTYRQMVLRIGVMVCGVALAMYATGWGPVFAFGYVFAAAENIRVDGSRVARPVVAWMVAATIVAQSGIAMGWIPSLIPQPEVQGLAVISILGAGFVIEVLGWSAATRERLENELLRLTHSDALTGLPNQLLLRSRLEEALARSGARGRNIGILFLDLDRFKYVNDSRGHSTGDALLVEVARRLERATRSGDTIARFGGDEFCILCEDLPPDRAEAVAVTRAQRMHDALMEPFEVNGTEILIGASIGVAIAGDPDSVEGLLRDADTAMYRAKASGLHAIAVFNGQLRERVLHQEETERALRGAIERREFALFVQPIIDLDTHSCVGAEALLRWQRPDGRTITPSAFMDLAEESGLIIPIGEWVLREAVGIASRWAHDAPEGFLLAVNISARQLEALDLAATIERECAAQGVDPALLCLEITETTLTSQSETTLETMGRLRRLGCSFSIDDFGTGYSSLSQLRWLPVDAVKIDRSFVRGLVTDRRDGAIVAGVTGLADAMGLRTIAEGVETEEQLAELMALGCRWAQGYLFARPSPAGTFAELVRSTGPDLLSR